MTLTDLQRMKDLEANPTPTVLETIELDDLLDSYYGSIPQTKLDPQY